MYVFFNIYGLIVMIDWFRVSKQCLKSIFKLYFFFEFCYWVYWIKGLNYLKQRMFYYLNYCFFYYRYNRYKIKNVKLN